MKVSLTEEPDELSRIDWSYEKTWLELKRKLGALSLLKSSVKYNDALLPIRGYIGGPGISSNVFTWDKDSHFFLSENVAIYFVTYFTFSEIFEKKGKDFHFFLSEIVSIYLATYLNFLEIFAFSRHTFPISRYPIMHFLKTIELSIILLWMESPWKANKKWNLEYF